MNLIAFVRARLRDFILFAETASSAPTPPAGMLAVYAKTDDKIYKKTSAGVETEVGAAATSSAAPTYVPSGTTYVVQRYTQVPYAFPPDVQGFIQCDGIFYRE